jgi:hypothetical protein
MAELVGNKRIYPPSPFSDVELPSNTDDLESTYESDHEVGRLLSAPEFALLSELWTSVTPLFDSWRGDNDEPHVLHPLVIDISVQELSSEDWLTTVQGVIAFLQEMHPDMKVMIRGEGLDNDIQIEQAAIRIDKFGNQTKVTLLCRDKQD